jgi:hypothetical protein
MPGKPTIVPPAFDEELQALKRKCASALWALVPKVVGRLYFAQVGGFNIFFAKSAFEGSELVPSMEDRSGSVLRTGPKTGDQEKPSNKRSQPVSQTVEDARSSSQAMKNVKMAPQQLDADELRVLSEIEEVILDVFSDAYCNKHLIYGVLELVLVRLMPELAERGVIDLWEERLS